MRYWLLLTLTVCLATTSSQEEDGGAERVEGRVDGVEVTSAEELAVAMGKWGVDLVDLDQDTIVTGEAPASLAVRPIDVKKDKRLAGSVVGYLMRYGFVEAAVSKTEEELFQADTFIGERDLKKALRKLQKYYRLNVTGEADNETIKLMRRKRCGVKDMEYERPNRAKRYTLSRKKWGIHTLNYWFDPTKYTADLFKADVRTEFEEALSKWSEVSHVNFVEVANKENAHITISWEYGDHNDGYPFYGPGGTLAHAFYPRQGMLHFDDAEEFTKGSIKGTNLRYVATHEIGHILGLKHADNRIEDAIMYALYREYSDTLQLHQDDIDGANEAMGIGSGTVTPLVEGGDGTLEPPVTPTPAAGGIPDCIERIDAAVKWDYSPQYLYVFAGNWYYRLVAKNPNEGNFLPILDSTAEPKRIGIDGFKGLPLKLDAAVETLEEPNQFYAFKGDRYFVYDFTVSRVLGDGSLTSGVVENGVLSDLWPSDTPAKIEGAFKIGRDSLGFIFEDKLYKYKKVGKRGRWLVGDAGSNFFDKYDDLDSISQAFYRTWAWVFRGNYYSVARSKNGVESQNYIYRSTTPDMKLPMCTEGVGQLSKKKKSKCRNELDKMKNMAGNYEPEPDCRDFVAKKYKGKVVFDKAHFQNSP